MEMSVLSYVNELCIYPRLLSSSQFRLRFKTDFDKSVCFTHANVVLSYINETVLASKSAFLQNSPRSFYGLGHLPLCQCYLKMQVVGEGPGSSL